MAITKILKGVSLEGPIQKLLVPEGEITHVQYFRIKVGVEGDDKGEFDKIYPVQGEPAIKVFGKGSDSLDQCELVLRAKAQDYFLQITAE